MINDIIVIDNIIPKSYQDLIEHKLLGETQSPWYIVNDVSYSDHKFKTNNPGFVNVFYEKGEVTSPTLNLLLPLLHTCFDQANYKFNGTIITIRSFLQFPDGTPSTPNNPHVDSKFPHLVCLYYVNDADGDTVLYEQTSLTLPIEEAATATFVEKQRVTPKKGRVVIFDGKYYHSSSNPVNGRRCIINFDVV